MLGFGWLANLNLLPGCEEIFLLKSYSIVTLVGIAIMICALASMRYLQMQKKIEKMHYSKSFSYSAKEKPTIYRKGHPMPTARDIL